MSTINNLTQKEIEFIRNLQKELNTQDNRGTADPYLYQIRSYQYVPAFELEGEYIQVVDNDGWDTSTYDNSSEGFMEFINDIIMDIDEDDEDLTEEEKAFLELKGGNYDWNDFYLIENITSRYYISSVEKEGSKVDDNIFFTEKAVLDYIEQYKYKYDRPYSYAIYLGRNTEIKQLISILKKINI